MTLTTLIFTTVIAATCRLSASAGVMTFDNPVSTGSAQAPGVWYTDRYAPAGFTSPINFAGDNRLRHTISAADGANSRPASFSSAFYNTQGRKFDIPGTQNLSVDLHVSSAWETSGRRMAGLWGTALDASDQISSYPIIEFASDGVNGRFQVWDSSIGDFVDVGLPTGFSYDEFVTLNILLDTNSDTFTISTGDAGTTIDALGSVQIANVILQGHNTTDGVDYDIYWDNLTYLDTAAVPEPASIVMFSICMLAFIGYAIRQRRTRVATAEA